MNNINDGPEVGAINLLNTLSRSQKKFTPLFKIDKHGDESDYLQNTMINGNRESFGDVKLSCVIPT